ncbi:MAG: hypothetical protein A2010_07530 [Nitrospirae bacterium GWD2_57_9]|nr:MAG: hypothetical protein A2010_07530 [Nitrospirae bacterium GWD2_57_9]
MKLADMIRRELESKGIESFSAAAEVTDVSTEVMRIILTKEHIPKDKTLGKIAAKLGLDPALVIVAAHKQRLSKDFEQSFLQPAAGTGFGKKRVWPLSQEQCEYLQKIMSPQEIQLLRKYRQITAEGQVQVRGYIDFTFMQHRKQQEVPQPMS